MLRKVLIPVIYNPEFLLQTKLDESVLRAAHRALIRHQYGITDSFLFVLCGDLDKSNASTAIARYGFPDASVVCVDTIDADGEEIDDTDIREMIDYEISTWLNKYHPAALFCLAPPEYDSLDYWWSGIEAIDVEWDFISSYSKTLPYDHRKKAATWIEILTELFDLDIPCWVNEMQFALYAATLCEWLHGFEAASGNGSNGFDAYEICNALGIDDFYLGFLLGQFNPRESLDEILYNAEVDDLAGIRARTLRLATAEERSTLRDKLSEFFGSDTGLLWTLYTAVWPKFNEISTVACCNFVGLSPYVDKHEAMQVWEFVTTGWSDSAYD